MKIAWGTECAAKSSETGFSLLEAITAMAVAGVVLVALYSGLTYGFARIHFSRENLRATQILMEKMETLRLYTWEQVNDTNFIPKTFTATYYPPGQSDKQGVVYDGTLSIEAAGLTTNYSNRVKKATVSLTWKTGNTPRSRSLTTYLAEYGIQNYVYQQHYH